MGLTNDIIKNRLNRMYGVMIDYADTDNTSVKNKFNINDVVYYYDDAYNVITSKRIASIKLLPDSSIIYNEKYDSTIIFATYEDAYNFAVEYLKNRLNNKIAQLKKGGE